MKKILPSDYPSLRDCIIASLCINGPMTMEELCQSLPLYELEYIRRNLMTVPHVKEKGLIELIEGTKKVCTH